MEILQFVQCSGVHGLHFGFEPESNLEYYRKVCVSLNVCEICASSFWAVSGLTFCSANKFLAPGTMFPHNWSTIGQLVPMRSLLTKLGLFVQRRTSVIHSPYSRFNPPCIRCELAPIVHWIPTPHHSSSYIHIDIFEIFFYYSL